MHIASISGHDAEVMAHVVPGDAAMPDDVARFILTLRLDDTATDRVEELLRKNRADTLSEEERAEFESYDRVGMLLNILQAKARLVLRQNESPGS